MTMVHGFKDLEGLMISIETDEIKMIREITKEQCVVIFKDDTSIKVAHPYEELERTLSMVYR